MEPPPTPHTHPSLHCLPSKRQVLLVHFSIGAVLRDLAFHGMRIPRHTATFPCYLRGLGARDKRDRKDAKQMNLPMTKEDAAMRRTNGNHLSTCRVMLESLFQPICAGSNARWGFKFTFLFRGWSRNLNVQYGKHAIILGRS